MVLLRREFSRRVASEAGAAARFVSSMVTALGDTLKKSALKKLNVVKFGRVSRRRPPGDMANPEIAIPRERKGVKLLKLRGHMGYVKCMYCNQRTLPLMRG